MQELIEQRRRRAEAQRRFRKAVALGSASALLAGAAGWVVGMKMGFRYAKQDAAYVLGAWGTPYEAKPYPQWRAWADTDIAYSPDRIEQELFDTYSLSIPGAGGVTTGDAYNAIQKRMRRDYFMRQTATSARRGK